MINSLNIGLISSAYIAISNICVRLLSENDFINRDWCIGPSESLTDSKWGSSLHNIAQDPRQCLWDRLMPSCMAEHLQKWWIMMKIKFIMSVASMTFYQGLCS